MKLLAILVFTFVAGVLMPIIYVFVDYRKHKRPLAQADPNVQYTLGHHVRIVTLPLLRYRLSVRLEKKPTGLIRRR